MGLWSGSSLPRFLGNCIDRHHPIGPSEGLLPLLPTYVCSCLAMDRADEIVGFFLSGTIYYALCKIFPLDRLDEVDEHDYFGTFG